VFKPLSNGDEDAYATRIGNFHKGLPHDANGNVNLVAYEAFLKAVSTGKFADFEAIPMGVANFADRFPLKKPAGGDSRFDLEGTDVCQFSMPASPALASAEAAGEMVEHYWQALLRDVHFADYATDTAVADACAELSAMSDYKGPKSSGLVTPQLLFRDDAAGATAGPYISQFLLRACPFGAVNIEQKMRTLIAGDDHMTDFATWLAIQNGAKPLATQNFDTVRRYIRNGRDLAQWVHVDVLYQAYFHAALILLTPPDAGRSRDRRRRRLPDEPGRSLQDVAHAVRLRHVRRAVHHDAPDRGRDARAEGRVVREVVRQPQVAPRGVRRAGASGVGERGKRCRCTPTC
jgi:hypothetical protein